MVGHFLLENTIKRPRPVQNHSQMLHVGKIYLHFHLNVAMFHLNEVNNPYKVGPCPTSYKGNYKL